MCQSQENFEDRSAFGVDLNADYRYACKISLKTFQLLEINFKTRHESEFMWNTLYIIPTPDGVKRVQWSRPTSLPRDWTCRARRCIFWCHWAARSTGHGAGHQCPVAGCCLRSLAADTRRSTEDSETASGIPRICLHMHMHHTSAHTVGLITQWQMTPISLLRFYTVSCGKHTTGFSTCFWITSKAYAFTKFCNICWSSLSVPFH